MSQSASPSGSESPSASEAIPDKIEPIRAWRAWGLRDDGRFFSANAGGGGMLLWPLGRPLEAECRQFGHDAPQENCTCGIYAHKDRQWIHEHYGHMMGAIGIVKLWGKVIEQEQGYRAQFADPEMIAIIDDPSRVPIYDRSGSPGIYGQLVISGAATSGVAMSPALSAAYRPARRSPTDKADGVLTGAELIKRVSANYPKCVVVPYSTLKIPPPAPPPPAPPPPTTPQPPTGPHAGWLQRPSNYDAIMKARADEAAALLMKVKGKFTKKGIVIS